MTIQPGAPWGGLGLRVSVRGFQWNNPQARDAIFGNTLLQTYQIMTLGMSLLDIG